jgi:hypothetical protein
MSYYALSMLRLRRRSDSIKGWTLIEAHSTDGSQDGTTVVHLCVACRPRLANLLAWLERTGSPN